MPASPLQGTPTNPPLDSRELRRHRTLLEALLAQARSGVLEVAVTDAERRQLVLDQWPVVGAKRIVAYRTGNGSDSVAVATATISTPATQIVLGGNEGRIGGQIVNNGSNAIILYLTDRPVPVEGVPAIYLAAAGGSWDFRLGNVLWCGNVSAVAQTSAGTLTIAEI